MKFINFIISAQSRVILLSILSDSYVATPNAKFLFNDISNQRVVGFYMSLNKTIGECNQVCLLPFVSIHTATTTLNLSGDFEQIN